jgi:putative glutamine amidotransferase
VRPVVGLTTYHAEARWGVWDRAADLLPATYARAVADAGGIPVLLPPLPAALAEEALTGVAALLLTGGPDVDHATTRESGQGTEPGSGYGRDLWEAALLRAALRLDLPVLGVCRGMQLMNVCLGGSLHAHLPDIIGNDDHQVGAGVFGRHAVRLAAGSRVARILGEADPTVAAYHHQAVDRLGVGLVATGWAADGIVEAIELPDQAFAVGVQWHPEEDDDRRLFQALVAAAADTAD